MSDYNLPCTVTYRNFGDSECELEFKSNTEGIATTYANLYRRVLLQNVPRMSVAGIRCVADEVVITNLFQPIDGLRGSLIDIIQTLHNTVYNIDTEDDIVIVSINVNCDKPFRASSLCDKLNYFVTTGDVKGISLASEDSLIASIVGNHVITFEIYFKNGVGFSQKDVNKMFLNKVRTDSEINEWIVTDSQHRGVPIVQYKSSVQLDRQVVTLHVSSYSNDIKSVISKCTDNILNQIEEFKLLLS